MANLVLTKVGEFFEVVDADRGVAVFSATNQSVAQDFINNGVVNPETVRQYARQDANYQGVETSTVPVSNPPDPQVSTQENNEPSVNSFSRVPAPANNYTETYNPETGQYDVVETNSGQVVASGLTEQAATLFAQDQSFADDGFGVPAPAATAEIYRAPANVPFGPGTGNSALQIAYDEEGNLLPGYTLNEDGSPVFVGGDFVEPATAAQAAADRTAAFTKLAQQQQTIATQRRQINNGDWRVRLRLAPRAKYLYNAPNPGILKPLQVTDGVVFPYTPSIDTAYKAEYDPYTLTHSNYKGYFYKSSYVDQLNLRCQFTAQSTDEANYLLAVITFFKSVTKMFYGQDAERGAPPPLVYLSGLGEYQFNEHPCAVTQFNYTLPADVDYIRAGSLNQVGLNLVNQRDRQNVATITSFSTINRLATALLTKGAIPGVPAPPSLSTGSPTYVPTKMEISITLLPMQSRQQVSKQFSLRDFANGNLIKGGFW